jgi:HPr kinase/phosphorylase
MAALEMRLAAGEVGLKRIIREPTVNRPGLALSGFTRYFAYKRVQVIGHAEVFYLRSLSARSARRVTPICSPTKFPASFSAAI